MTSAKLSVQQALDLAIEQWKDCPLELINEVIGEFFLIEKIECVLGMPNIAMIGEYYPLDALFSSEKIDLYKIKDFDSMMFIKGLHDPWDVVSLTVYNFGDITIFKFEEKNCRIEIQTPWGSFDAQNYSVDIEHKYEMLVKFYALNEDSTCEYISTDLHMLNPNDYNYDKFEVKISHESIKPIIHLFD